MTVLIKVGGARAVDPAGALADVATLAEEADVVVTHGGSTAVDDTLERLGREPEYVETPDGVVGRFTDEETMEVFEMVLPGRLNTQLVAGLQTEGVGAVGLSGVDGKLLYGPRKSAVRILEDGKRKIRRGDHSGSLEEVNVALLETLLADGYTPVVSPPMAGAEEGTGGGPGDGGGSESGSGTTITPVNIDADRSAAAIGGALGATVVLLTDVAGIFADPDDPSTVIERVETPADFEHLRSAAEGFMGRKVMAIETALAAGAERVIVADANAETPVLSALDGAGTHVLRSAVAKPEDGGRGDDGPSSDGGDRS